MKMKQLYDPAVDPAYQKPYIDRNEWQEENGYYYIHGGFEGTELRFSFFFPKKEDYVGRFFQFLPPVQGHEDAAVGRKGLEDRIGFTIAHGAYYIETNMGVAPFAPMADARVLYRASAAAAHFSRTVAVKMYGEHRAYGYVYGGSGGSYKTIACVENTAVWDGAAPYVTGTPMSVPYSLTIRTHTKRVLRRVLPLIADYVEPGGISREELFSHMTQEEISVFEEAERFGFPVRDWFLYRELDDGSLPLFIELLENFDPQYFKDFWEKEGYLGADPQGSARKDRIRCEAKVLQLHVPETAADDCVHRTGVDDAWRKSELHLKGKAWMRTGKYFGTDAYLDGVSVFVRSGKARGFRAALESAQGDIAILKPMFGCEDFTEKLSAIQIGDTVEFDNSGYIALQSYHRHQVPDREYSAWDVYRKEDGSPKFPQRDSCIGPMIACGGCGSVQDGDFGNVKMIVTAALMDESALPWQQDWYRQTVRKARGGDEDRYRLWYVDHALHGDTEKTADDLHLVSYLGVLHQALLSVSDWVERGVAPCESSSYAVTEGLVSFPKEVAERKGVQPVVDLCAGGGKSIAVRAGDIVRFCARVNVPQNAGALEKIEWAFADEQSCFEEGEFLSLSADGSIGYAEMEHRYTKSGTYFAVVRATSNKNRGDFYTRVMNIDRVRIVVR